MRGQGAVMAAARALSFVSRPYYVPVSLFVSLFTFTGLRLLPAGYKLWVTGLAWAFTVALPRLCVWLWRRLNGWAPAQLRRRERRAVPYVLFLLSYAGGLQLMWGLHLPRYMCGIVVAALLVQAVGAVVNVWWKISMHCAGAGGLVGALVAYSALFGFDPTGWLCVLILLCGAVGTARMLLRQHSLGQVVAGTLAGAAASLAGILWL